MTDGIRKSESKRPPITEEKSQLRECGCRKKLYVWYLACVLVIQWDYHSVCVKIRCLETASEDCNRLRTLVFVCQWSVKCSHESWVYKWSINWVTTHKPWQYNKNLKGPIWCEITKPCGTSVWSVSYAAHSSPPIYTLGWVSLSERVIPPDRRRGNNAERVSW
jgi:hypothetical protein